ncbi:hypothetical protein [Acidaminococcus fermentans]|uniref:hypothetical protein n=1 Tax=Acidaminococcus fermentans TaxID=905 RepID=UPI000336E32B|nr:hypothetical protein [Acidaminococcus fermentans]CDE94120.1 unknown [Acidaminococcus sp. CAG:542]
MASKDLLRIRMKTAKKILTKLHELAVKPDLSEVERIGQYDPLLQFWLDKIGGAR